MQSEAFATLDHQAQHLVHEVFAVGSGALDLLPQRGAHFAQHAGGFRRGTIARRGGEHLEQQFVRARAARQPVAREFLPVVLAQRAGLLRDILDGAAIRDQRLLIADFLGKLIDELQLGIGRPALVVAPPWRIRLEPYGKRFGKIFGRMRLGVPRPQVLHEAAAAGPRPIGVGVRQRSRPEHRAPVTAPPQTVGRINCVPRFVAQNAHEPVAIAALYFAHESALDADQALVSEVERYGDSWNAVGRKPLLSEPAMRAKAHASHRQFAIKTLDGALQLGALNGQLQIAEAQVQELIVRQLLPDNGSRSRPPRALHLKQLHLRQPHLRVLPPRRPRRLPSSSTAHGPRGRQSRTAWYRRVANRKYCKCWRKSPRYGRETPAPSGATCFSRRHAACWPGNRTACRE